ncbi:MAG TPA: DUF6160 family protein [Noviherbaspirillum sp.]|nr:DUF6160 family protein [Noviherbaspirillum sp.]
MKLIKKSAIALALSAVSFGAFAMTSIDDAALSQVSGQDGVSIVADLNINIGSFTYTDKDATNGNGSVSFNNIGIRGGFIMTIDVLSGAAFGADAVGALLGNYYTTNGATSDVASATALAGAISTALGRDPAAGSDVVRFAFPQVGDGVAARKASMSITVDSITTGNGGASFGSVALKNFDLQGTKVWMFGH